MMSGKAAWLLGVLVVCLFAATPSVGGLLDAGTAYNDGTDTWRGTTPIVSGNPHLTGTVDYVVYGPGAFPFGNSATFTPNNAVYTYVYQVHSTGSDNVSSYTVDMENLANNIGWFGDSPLVSPTHAELSPAECATWQFGGDPGGLSGYSAGLAFSSPYAPQWFSSALMDGGTVGLAIPVPSPSSTPIPEPGTLVLMAVAAAIAVGAKRFVGR